MAVTPNAPAPTRTAGPRYRQDALDAFHDGFRAAGIDFAVFLPDSMLDGVEQLLQERGGIACYQCSREDEGIAMAMGAFLVGKKPVALMEGSGSASRAYPRARHRPADPYVDRRGPQQHPRRAIRLPRRHAARCRTDLRALNIPYHVLFDASQIRTAVVQAQRTVEGQRIPVAILVPPFVIREPSRCPHHTCAHSFRGPHRPGRHDRNRSSRIPVLGASVVNRIEVLEVLAELRRDVPLVIGPGPRQLPPRRARRRPADPLQHGYAVRHAHGPRHRPRLARAPRRGRRRRRLPARRAGRSSPQSVATRCRT